MSDSLGVGIACVYSVGPRFTLATEEMCLAQSLARRLITERGRLPWAPNDCTDMREYLNRSNTPTDRFAAARAAKDECEKDERVQSADVDAKYESATSSLKLTIGISTASGSFRLVLLVEALKIEILAVA